MSAEKQVGLFGELLPRTSDWADRRRSGSLVLAGSKPREHDFVFEALHLEVKTTTGERRKHMIHGLTQLVLVPGAGLAVISVQLTQSTLEAGTTLPELVNRIRSPHGWPHSRSEPTAGVSDLVRRRCRPLPHTWELRSVPRAYRVTDDPRDHRGVTRSGFRISA